MKVHQLIKLLQDYHQPDDSIAASLWSQDDIYNCISPDKLTQEECNQVLDEIDENHDAETGISWGTCHYYIDKIITEREE